MNYALGYAFNLTDLFENFKSSNLIIDCASLVRLYNEPFKKKLAIRMFKDCVKLVINDIIENDVEFLLPTGSRKSSLIMQSYSDDLFKTARKNGAFKDVDFLSSLFTGYLLMFYIYGYNRTIRSKRVYLNPTLRDKITQLTNEGKAYSGIVIKTINDYYLPIKKLYPWIPNKDIVRILKFGWKSFYLHNSYGGDVLIKDKSFWLYVGNLNKDSLKHYNYYVNKLCLKMRVLAHRRNYEWDGYYYFALSDTLYEAYLKQINKRGRPRKIFSFGNVMLYKLLDECKVKQHSFKYIFKVSLQYDFGFTYYIKDFKSDNAKLIIERNPLKLKDILVNNNDYEIL